jgi:hypothetical protein
MNTDTGQVYDLREEVIGDLEIGDKLAKQTMEAKMAELSGQLSCDEMAAAVDLAKGDTIVRVSPEAAQRARLGDRELRRRRQRRR